MKKWAAGSDNRGDKLSLLLLLAVFIQALAAVLLPGPVPVLGNLHDLFIPLNAAEVVRDDVSLHHDFHSPFGWVYFHLNYVSDELLAELAPWVSTPGALMLSGLVFFVPIVVVWFLFRRAVAESPALGLWLLPFLLALMVSPREISEFSHKNLLWYGLYNNHNWGVILLQAALFASLARGISKMDGLLVAVGLAGCLYLTAHYKISFFFASGLLAAACIVLSPPRSRVQVSLLTGLWFGLMCLVTWLAGYDYTGYLSDITMAFDAKVKAGFEYGALILTSTLVFLAVLSVLASAYFSSGTRVLAAGAAVSGIAVAVAGDWSEYLGYPFLLLALVLLAAPVHWSGRTVPFWLACSFLGLNFILNAMSVGRVIELKLQGEKKEGYLEAVLRQQDGRDLRVMLPEPETLTLTALSEFYNVADEKVWLRLAVFDVPDRRVIPRYEDLEYMRAHREAQEWAASPAGRNKSIGEVEFVNPYPLLTGKSALRGLHWLHLDNTLGRQHLPAALEHVLDWDAILVPVTSADGLSQARLSCAAFTLIRERAPDVGLARATMHYIYLIRNAVEVDRERWHELDRRIVQPACEALPEDEQG